MPNTNLGRRQLLQMTGTAALFAGLPAFVGVGPAAAGGLKTVEMQLGWLASNGLLGEVVAQNKGYYEAEGVELKITPGGPNVDGVGSVAAGRAAVGQISSSPSVMLARSAGIPVKAFAAGYQKHPFTYFSLAGDPIRAPQDMVGKTIATQPTAHILLKALLVANDIPEDQVEIVNMGSDMNQLLTGQAAAVTGWLTNTAALDVLGEDRVDLMLWDTGIQLYATVYYATDETIETEAETLAGFTRATARGWADVRADPEAAVEMLVAAYPNLDREAELRAVRQVLDFVFTDATAESGWGTMDRTKWERQIASYADLGQFDGNTPTVDDVMTLKILEMTADARREVS
ncbi:ABC transporter substrate-binding protein [Limimaricola pyoseonensis]|uniref:Thiamine pyrimidine synthase n=1 Tax=Limimaricola pyoseonensis TaxID=521013 RepID=A0A1G7FLS5_9RHOB|nr:ABC transporter substrate-binding protein [Limimaricola pyoseonensis]SDE76820.1 NitT/TauT family transport system substrate-binding protein [Limimaricola pyoseonensis]